jgi:hypothetical protein
MPVWLVVVIALLLVVGIGYIDFITGDYSVLIFYAIPAALAGWVAGDWGAIVIALAAGVARYYSDYHSYTNTLMRDWNCAEDVLFLLIFGLLLSNMKRILDEEKKGRDR